MKYVLLRDRCWGEELVRDDDSYDGNTVLTRVIAGSSCLQGDEKATQMTAVESAGRGSGLSKGPLGWRLCPRNSRETSVAGTVCQSKNRKDVARGVRDNAGKPGETLDFTFR